VSGRARRVAVLGTGTMGAPIARNLLRARFDLKVWNRSPARAAALVASGAWQASTPAEAVTGADVVITMLTDGAAVEHVMAGPAGALSNLTPGAVWVQMSTVGVEWCDRLATLARRHGVVFVDAPVSGSSAVAEQGQLIILASGDGPVRLCLEPIFKVLGKQTIWLQSSGDGSKLKLALNNWLSVLVEGMVETLTLCAALELDPQVFLTAVSAGPLASEYALTKGEAMLNAQFVPGFPLRHAAKDAELALSAAHRHGVELPLTGALLPRWHQAIATDHGDDDIASAITAAATTASPPGKRLIASTT
jgi:3-hydroxyisobutyrate dehydrogenase